MRIPDRPAGAGPSREGSVEALSYRVRGAAKSFSSPAANPAVRDALYPEGCAIRSKNFNLLEGVGSGPGPRERCNLSPTHT